MNSSSIIGEENLHKSQQDNQPIDIDPEEHDVWCQRMWARMDRNHDENITTAELDCEEFRAVLRGVLAPQTSATTGGSLYTRVEMNMNQALNFCMRKADLNDNAELSFPEFKAFMMYLRQHHVKKHTADMIFSLFDLDGDNSITESEFREIYRFYLGHMPREEEFQREWARMDIRGLQKVSKAGYILWLQTSQNPVFKQHAPTESRSPESTVEKLPGLTRGNQSLRMRPKWNQRFNAGANPNPASHPGQRQYFSRPQSLPELTRYFDTHRGFKTATKQLAQPLPMKPRAPLSTDTGFELLPDRSSPAGTMRDRRTGKVQKWRDDWQTPAAVKMHYQPGTLDLRCPGPPPKHTLHEDDLG